MQDLEDNELFWKIVFRNRGKTILLDFPDKWLRLTVSERGSIKSEVDYTLQDIGIYQNQFEEFKDSKNLKLAFSNAFNSSSFQKAFVVKNDKIEQKKRFENER